MSEKLKKYIEAIIDNFIEDLAELANKMPSLVVSSVTSINDHRMKVEIKGLIEAFNDIYASNIELYIALEKEVGEPIQEIEKKRLTKIIFENKRALLNRYIKIIKAKAYVYLEDVAEDFDPLLKEKLKKLANVTLDDMKKAWLSELPEFPL